MAFPAISHRSPRDPSLASRCNRSWPCPSNKFCLMTRPGSARAHRIEASGTTMIHEMAVHDAVPFDLDGVLVDSRVPFARSVNSALTAHGLPAPIRAHLSRARDPPHFLGIGLIC